MAFSPCQSTSWHYSYLPLSYCISETDLKILPLCHLSWPGLFILFHLTLPFNIQVECPHICAWSYLVQISSFLRLSFLLPFDSVIALYLPLLAFLSFKLLFISPFILLCALITLLQTKSSWHTEHRTHCDSDFSSNYYFSVLAHGNKNISFIVKYEFKY